MKKILMITASVLMLMAFIPAVNAQEEEEETSSWNAGLDIYSSYIWRGSKFGSGPAFQPAVSFATGGLEIGAWGSVSSSTDEAFEMDLYASYSIGGFSIGLTDYYFGGDWMSDNSHYLEPSLSFGIGGFSIAGYYMFLAGSDEDPGIPGSPAMVDLETGEITPAVDPIDPVKATSLGSSGDMYFEAGYSFKHIELALGAGDGQYTDNGDFKVCVISVGTSKEIKITDNFSLPLSGAVILNPSTKGFFITAGISL